MRSLILVNLTRDDYNKFMIARIGYSGSTGREAKPESYGGHAPYIATYENEFFRAVEAMGWKRIKIVSTAPNLIVRQDEEEQFDISPIPTSVEEEWQRAVRFQD